MCTEGLNNMEENCCRSPGIAHRRMLAPSMTEDWSPHAVGCRDIRCTHSQHRDAIKETLGKKENKQRICFPTYCDLSSPASKMPIAFLPLEGRGGKRERVEGNVSAPGKWAEVS